MCNLADPLLIGVDGGGTGCRVAVGNRSDGILAEATGTRANMTTDPDLAIESIRGAVQVATLAAGYDLNALDTAVAHLGLAGILTPEDAEKLCKALAYGHCIATDDRPTAVAGALDGQDGFLVSVGTGTIIAASRAGSLRFVGGWGFYVADQASGAWLGRAALDRALQAHDGVLAHSDLTRELMARFHDDPSTIVTFSVRAKPGDYGTFAPAVLDAAGSGDPIGLALVQEGADYIGRGLAALDFAHGDALCLTGGVGPHYEQFLPASLTDNIIEPKHSSVHGAFLLARRAAEDLERAEA